MRKLTLEVRFFFPYEEPSWNHGFRGVCIVCHSPSFAPSVLDCFHFATHGTNESWMLILPLLTGLDCGLCFRNRLKVRWWPRKCSAACPRRCATGLSLRWPQRPSSVSCSMTESIRLPCGFFRLRRMNADQPCSPHRVLISPLEKHAASLAADAFNENQPFTPTPANCCLA